MTICLSSKSDMFINRTGLAYLTVTSSLQKESSEKFALRYEADSFQWLATNYVVWTVLSDLIWLPHTWQ